MESPSFGQWLRRRRKALDLTREGLAYQVACSAATIRKIEAEERRPSVQIAERLADIFNIPLPERASFIRFARGEWQSAPKEVIEELPWHAAKKSPRLNLPSSITSFIGRERDLELVRGYLTKADIRLITLIGPPGIGKTRLSIEAARASLPDFPDGVFFVSLAPLEDASLIGSAIAQSLGYVEGKNLPANQQLMNGIGDKQILLVLDNCEHLVEDVATFVSDILSDCSRVKILATSREALRIPGEWLYSVPALGTPKGNRSVEMDAILEFPSLKLFVERARSVHSGFTLNPNNLQAVVSICSQLDGLPLAIELIAARLRLMSPQALLERMTDQFVLTADGMRGVSSRQRTLGNAIEWSYNLLPPEEQKMLASLAVFSGGFTFEAAEAVCRPAESDKSIIQFVTSLLDKSLLQRVSDANGEQRFNMLVTIQQFSLDRLRNSGEETEIKDRHLAYFLALAERGDKEMHGPLQVEWIERIENQHDNFRAALDWCVSNHKTESALRLLLSLGWPWEVRGHYEEARCWLDRIRAQPDLDHYPATYARLLNHIGRHSWTQGKIDDARALLEESQAISSKLGEAGELCLAETLNWLGLVLNFSDRDSIQAKSLFERARALYRKQENENGIALSTFHLGITEIDLNNDAVALQLLEQSLKIFRQLGDLLFIARVSIFLGYLYLKQEDYEKAYMFFKQHLEIDTELQFWDGIASGWFNLGNLYRQQGKYDQASQSFEQSVIIGSEHGINVYDSLYHSGLLALYCGNYDLAFQRFSQTLSLARKSGKRTGASILLMGWAAASCELGQPQRAARLYCAARTMIETFGDRCPPNDRAEFEHHIQIAREQLGAPLFEALQAEGGAMTTEQAIEYALEMD